MCQGRHSSLTNDPLKKIPAHSTGSFYYRNCRSRIVDSSLPAVAKGEWKDEWRKRERESLALPRSCFCPPRFFSLFSLLLYHPRAAPRIHPGNKCWRHRQDEVSTPREILRAPLPRGQKWQVLLISSAPGRRHRGCSTMLPVAEFARPDGRRERVASVCGQIQLIN